MLLLSLDVSLPSSSRRRIGGGGASVTFLVDLLQKVGQGTIHEG